MLQIIGSRTRSRQCYAAESRRFTAPDGSTHFRVALVDYGAKANIIKGALQSEDARSRQFPASTTRRGDPCRLRQTALCSPTAPATRRKTRPKSASSASSLGKVPRCSASASGISCWRWRRALEPKSSNTGTAALISRCSDLCGDADVILQARTTAMR